MTITQYHRHHSLRDEEDLFHSALSNEFDDGHTGQVNNSGGNRPWAIRLRRDDRDREPYELLDDVPPADLEYSRAVNAAANEIDKHAMGRRQFQSNDRNEQFFPDIDMTQQQHRQQHPARKEAQLFPDILDETQPPKMSRATTDRVDNRSEPRRFESEVNTFPDGLLNEEIERASLGSVERQQSNNSSVESPPDIQRKRYPVEDLYPSDNHDEMMEDNYDNDEVEYDLGNDDDYYSHMQYSEPVGAPTAGPSRYPIDDGYNSDRDRPKKVGWYDEQANEPSTVSPSDSGELDSYQPMHLYQHKSKVYDDNASSSHYSDEKSTGTFDRLYDEEYSGIYSTPVENGDVKSDQSSAKRGSEVLSRISPEHSPDSVMDTPSSASSSFVGDLVFGANQDDTRRSNVEEEKDIRSPDELSNRGGDGMPTPLRSNRVEATEEIDKVNDPPELPFGMENHSPRAEVESKVDANAHVDKTPNSFDPASSSPQQAATPQSNTTGSSSPGFESDEDSAIQHLAKVMQDQQRQHRGNAIEAQRKDREKKHQEEVLETRMEEECEDQRKTTFEQVPRSRGRMSRLEQWQEKLRQREEKQKRQTANYLPGKYQKESHAVEPAVEKRSHKKLEPKDVNAKDPSGVRYHDEQALFPDMEWDEHGRVMKKARSIKKTEADFMPKAAPDAMDPPELDYDQHSNAVNLVHPANLPSEEFFATRRAEPRQRSSRYSGPHHQVPDELSLLESYHESSNNALYMNDRNSINDDVSVISVDTELLRLAECVPQKDKLQQKNSFHPYSIKPKDSMESDMKMRDDYEEHPKDYPSKTVKRNDSMEDDMMIVDFDEEQPTKLLIADYPYDYAGLSIVDYSDDKSQSVNSMRSHHLITGQTFGSAYQIEEEKEEDIVAELTSYSEDGSDATNNPAIFPTRAVYQMNLGKQSVDGENSEAANDLIEKACELLARGKNNDALKTLNEALYQAEAKMEEVKELMDEHYYNKERGLKPPTSEQLQNEEEFEEKLDADFRETASEMADVINNIGVVHELNGDYHIAMNAFRDALDIYRRMCHRYENAGDADVDRAVSNIMHMGIAMRSREKREELHSEADEINGLIKSSNDPDERMELMTERLNILMAVLEIENESLGRNHPTVGFTLLEKGKLHLEMNHVDLAINNIKDAITILKEGLGPIHPAVGSALLYLADVYNYQGPSNSIMDRNTALHLYEESIVAFSESDEDSNLGLAHNSMGIIFASRGENDLAMTSFYNALAGYGVRAKGEDSLQGQTHPDVAFVWLNVGDLHMDSKEWQLALRSYLKALSALHSLNEDQRKSLCRTGSKRMARDLLFRTKERCEGSDALLAFVLQQVAKAQSMLHKYGKSIEQLEEALRIHRIIDLRCKDGGQANGWSKEIARILEHLGEVQLASGNITLAMNCYVESLARLRANGNCDNNGIEVALVLGAIGNVHLKQGEYSEATVILKECMRLFETIGVPQNNRRYTEVRSSLVDAELALMQNASSTLAGQRRDISEIKYIDRALACDELADSYKNKDDLTTAIWFYSEALSVRRKKLDGLSGSVKDSYFVDIGKTISMIAEMRLKRREFEATKILLDEAKNIYKAVGLSEEHPMYRDLTDKIEALRKA